MSEVVPFCYPPEGSMLVLGDGPELYVYSGTNDAPMWKKFCDGLLVGVGATREMVISLDADGRLASWRGIDGAPLDETRVEAKGVQGLANASDGRCAVVAEDAVALTTPRGGGRTVTIPGVTVVAFAPSGSVGAGTSGGRFCVIDTSTGTVAAGCDVGAPVTGVAWRYPGQWIVAAGRSVRIVAPDAAGVLASIDIGAQTGRVACSGDGALVAVVTGQEVVVVELHQNRKVGAIKLNRDVHGVGFGTGAWLGIGLDQADANRVDLISGQMCRTEAHVGRVANRWAIRVEVDPMLVRQAVTAVRAGGQPIARQILPTESQQGGRGCLWTCLGVVLLSLLCAGCSGLVGIWYYGFYNPYY